MSLQNGATRVAAWRWWGFTGLLLVPIGVALSIGTPEVRCVIGLGCEEEEQAEPPPTVHTTSKPHTTVSTSVITESIVTTTTKAAALTTSPSSTSAALVAPVSQVRTPASGAAPPASTSTPEETPTPATEEQIQVATYPPAELAAGGHCPTSVQYEEGRSWDPPSSDDWYDYFVPMGSPVDVRIHHPGPAEKGSIIGGDNLPTVPVEALTLQGDCRLLSLGTTEAGGNDLQFTVPAGSAVFARPLQAQELTNGFRAEAGVIQGGWLVTADADSNGEVVEVLQGW